MFTGEMSMKFTIHRHVAEKAGEHYDLRIETPECKESDVCVRSFYSRKPFPTESGPRISIGEEVLHSKEIITFTGEIAEGYGKGSMEIVDTGEAEWIPTKGKDEIKIKLTGSKYKGEFVIISTPQYGEKRFLFLKKSGMSE